MRKGGAFCETYGLSMQNLVLENLLENQWIDFAVGDLAKEIKISRPKAYETIKIFEKRKIVIKSRIIGKTQLYILNKDNNLVKFFLRNFKECLKLVTENEKNASINHSSSTGLAYAKHA